MQNKQTLTGSILTIHPEVIDRLARALLQWSDVPELKHRFSEMVEIYVQLTRIQGGFPPNREMLLGLGEGAEVIHEVTRRSKGGWAVFRNMVSTSHPDIPSRTPLQANDGTILDSVAEVFAYEILCRIAGIERITAHPLIDPERGSSHRADFLVRSGEKSEFVEITMVRRASADDSPVEQAYRKKFNRKLAIYEIIYGKPPIIFWADELAPLRLVKERINELLVRLDQPPLPVPMDVLPTLRRDWRTMSTPSGSLCEPNLVERPRLPRDPLPAEIR